MAATIKLSGLCVINIAEALIVKIEYYPFQQPSLVW